MDFTNIIATSPELRNQQTSMRLNPIIPFDLVIDVDLGLIRLIDESYRDESVFDLDVLDLNFKNIIVKLLERDNLNPLSIIMKDKSNQNLMDQYYKSFMINEYDNILDSALYTGIEGAIEMFLLSGLLDPCILCRSQKEEELIKSISDLRGVNTIVGSLSSIDTNEYDPVYIKDYRDLLQIKNLEGKNIYLANYNFNFEKTEDGQKVPLKDISILFLDANQLTITDVYSIDDSYYDVG